MIICDKIVKFELAKLDYNDKGYLQGNSQLWILFYRIIDLNDIRLRYTLEYIEHFDLFSGIFH
jgi:hypothetical protein